MINRSGLSRSEKMKGQHRNNVILLAQSLKKDFILQFRKPEKLLHIMGLILYVAVYSEYLMDSRYMETFRNLLSYMESKNQKSVNYVCLLRFITERRPVNPAIRFPWISFVQQLVSPYLPFLR